MEVEILTAHRLTERDTSPLQFISAELLAHYRRCEADLARLQREGLNTPARASEAGNGGMVGSAGFEPAAPTV